MAQNERSLPLPPQLGSTTKATSVGPSLAEQINAKRALKPTETKVTTLADLGYCESITDTGSLGVDANRVAEFNEEGTEEFHQKMQKLAKMVRKSQYTVFYTGAGVSTSAGIGDFRGPAGLWTHRRTKELEQKSIHRTPEEEEELLKLKASAAQVLKKAETECCMLDAQPTHTHMAMATLLDKQIAHYVVTTNQDGIFRKAGLKPHTQLCCLHGDVYIERCTSCGYDFERNYHVRQEALHIHDHSVGTCERCGSKRPENYRGYPKEDEEMYKSRWGGVMVGTRDRDCGTKDTQINFGEYLDKIDANEATLHCSKADLCIIAGSSMSLRHITHIPFLAKKVVLINLQATPDDSKATLRIWARSDSVFESLMGILEVPLNSVPVWRPRDAVPILQIPKWVNQYFVTKAIALEEVALEREREAKEREERENGRG